MAPQAHARGMPVGVPARGGSGRGKFLAPGADVPATAIGIQPCNREPQPKPEKAVSVAVVIHSRTGPVIWRDDCDHPSRLSRPKTDEGYTRRYGHHDRKLIPDRGPPPSATDLRVGHG